MVLFSAIKFFLIFYLFHLTKYANVLKPLSDLYIYDLKINHQKNPFSINIEGNTFSFLSKEKGPFKAFLYIKDKIVQSRHVHLEECHSFTFLQPLQYNQKYRYIIQGTNTRNEIEFETTIKLESSFIKPKDKKIFSPIFFKNFDINLNEVTDEGR